MDSTRFTEIANKLLYECNKTDCKKYQCGQSNCDKKSKCDLKKYNKKSCPDDIVGDGKKFWFDREEREKHKDDLDIKNSTLKYQKTMVIVLESPHIDEFKKSTFIHPALGPTGKNLQRYFPIISKWAQKIYDINSNFLWRTILMNSIQYQCSLGEKDTHLYRDHMWLNLWFDEKLSYDFKNRLQLYNPDIIFNFCTKGKHDNEKNLPSRTQTVINAAYLKHCAPSYCRNKKNIKLPKTLREIVGNSIDDLEKNGGIKDFLYIEGNHPCLWNNKHELKIVKKFRDKELK